jgi:hypothetical protein
MPLSISASPKPTIDTPTDMAGSNCVKLMNYQESDMSNAMPKHLELNFHNPAVYNTLQSPLVETAEMPDCHLNRGLHFISSTCQATRYEQFIQKAGKFAMSVLLPCYSVKHGRFHELPLIVLIVKQLTLNLSYVSAFTEKYFPQLRPKKRSMFPATRPTLKILS